MTAFSASPDRLGNHDVAVLEDDARQRQVRIVSRGAAVIGIEIEHAGARFQLADAHRDLAEVEKRPGSRFAAMAPFANRIEDARYTFDGQLHDLAPGVEGSKRESRHGFLRDAEFLLEKLHANEAGAHAVFVNQDIRPGVHPGYPFAIDVSIQYTLASGGLELLATMRNVGDVAAPCFFGWHPYFRVADGKVDDWELQIPASLLVRTDADYIPLPGDAAYAALDDEPSMDFRQWRRVGDTELNHGYAGLHADADGRARTRLRDPSSGLTIALWQTRGIVLAFSADTVPRDARRALALEPMESMSNAFNRDDCAAAIRLEPGAERQFHCGIEIEQA
ncbi:aldose epimerase [Dyella sp.]|uniref:aldose 1-epimerase n=1 Tax=Dyella sp. TaxID=1869338 RepID=UPI002ED4D3C7